MKHFVKIKQVSTNPTAHVWLVLVLEMINAFYHIVVSLNAPTWRVPVYFIAHTVLTLQLFT